MRRDAMCEAAASCKRSDHARAPPRAVTLLQLRCQVNIVPTAAQHGILRPSSRPLRHRTRAPESGSLSEHPSTGTGPRQHDMVSAAGGFADRAHRHIRAHSRPATPGSPAGRRGATAPTSRPCQWRGGRTAGHTGRQGGRADGRAGGSRAGARIGVGKGRAVGCCTIGILLPCCAPENMCTACALARARRNRTGASRLPTHLTAITVAIIITDTSVLGARADVAYSAPCAQ
jgi:hypothetical protein